jgi:hypothetical protein
MLVGIISDTHDDTTVIRKAVDYFNAEKVSHVIHAGDITSPFTFEIFRDLKSKFTGIFGNNDGDKLLLTEKSGGNIHNQPHFITIGGKKIVIMHEPDLVSALAHSGDFNIIIYGHTHRPVVKNVKDTLIINPGKAARLYKGESTLALLNTAKMEARIVKIT